MVPGAGLEPARPYGQGILSPQCLPFHHPGIGCRDCLNLILLSSITAVRNESCRTGSV